MTDEERRNRNPKVEVVRTSLTEIEAEHPRVTSAELEIHRVYLLQSARNISTLNYMGRRHLLHPVTLDAVTTHHFHGPRAALDVFLVANPDGSFSDAVGTRITVRRYTGTDV